ncbi:MAG TPA: cation-translocating P-type ATPase [Ohtaekwangia sp.]|uniref:cation-translocating P-type ATPase n=1 Tax=Ohtaekwangia sp. TaxID=2066019 RepID=UPI002F95626C
MPVRAAEEVLGRLAIKGLTAQEMEASRALHGSNKTVTESRTFLHVLLDLFREPMLLLLIIVAGIYFIMGNSGDGFFMLAAIVVVTGISLYQESRTKSALAMLQSLTQPMSTVVRDGVLTKIPREELVVGDYILIEEGASIPADGTVIRAHDFTVNESILTGESLPVEKNAGSAAKLYQGTSVSSGWAIGKVEAVGIHTSLGKIGESLKAIDEEETPLQKQIRSFVRKMAWIGITIFLLVWAVNFVRSYRLLESLLQALTLAMSVLPEEIPVAFTTFMALGAWRLMKLGVIVKNIATVEALGSATVICTDKTGTLTENRMSLAKIYSLSSGKITAPGEADEAGKDVITYAMWASESIPFDAMEVALHEAYDKISAGTGRRSFRMIHEYPLEGRPPMMTHAFENTASERIIAAKGAPEAIMNVSILTDKERQSIQSALQTLTTSGYRVLGVGISDFKGSIFPGKQQQLQFIFKGLVAFFDPPKANIPQVLDSFYKAGMQVKIITGDNAATTATIARDIKFRGYEKAIEGEELLRLTDEEMRRKVTEVNIFTRMFPEAKLKIVNALKANGHIVAMTGDGVNDAPALKAAHISIAMGKRGSEAAKNIASLVLVHDDLQRMVDAVGIGRRIYANLKKAIQYIISIHIPIVLMVFLPLALGWIYPVVFTPVHVIMLELIMGPTCSIVYEHEPIEQNAMNQKPRPASVTFFNARELGVSIAQGIVITLALIAIYFYAVYMYGSALQTRTMVFTSLILCNIFLTLVNRSFHYSIFTTLRYRNNFLIFILILNIALLALLLFVTPVTSFFLLKTLSPLQWLICLGVSFVSVIWIEFWKMWSIKFTR